jgi:hypothetical protein
MGRKTDMILEEFLQVNRYSETVFGHKADKYCRWIDRWTSKWTSTLTCRCTSRYTNW